MEKVTKLRKTLQNLRQKQDKIMSTCSRAARISKKHIVVDFGTYPTMISVGLNSPNYADRDEQRKFQLIDLYDDEAIELMHILNDLYGNTKEQK